MGIFNLIGGIVKNVAEIFKMAYVNENEFFKPFVEESKKMKEAKAKAQADRDTKAFRSDVLKTLDDILKK